MAETYNDLRSFARAIVASSCANDTPPDFIEVFIEGFIRGPFGRFAQQYFDEHGEYPQPGLFTTRLDQPMRAALSEAPSSKSP